MNRKLDVEIFPPAECCAQYSPTTACHKLWEVWCRGCCLVYCKGHIRDHQCRNVGGLGTPRKLPQGAQAAERGRGSVRKYNASGGENGRGKH